MVLKKSKLALNKAVEFLNNGGVVVCPTDTVYGFLALAGNKKAVNKIYKIKKRPKSKPLPIFLKDLKSAKVLVEIDAKQEKIIKSKWPGKYTFILPSLRGAKATKQSRFCETRSHTVAIRIPKYKFLNDLLKKINKPLAQTSVNISDNPPLVKISDIMYQFGKYDILIIDAGNLKKSKPSRIIDLTGDVLTRIR